MSPTPFFLGLNTRNLMTAQRAVLSDEMLLSSAVSALKAGHLPGSSAWKIAPARMKYQ